MQLEPIIVYRRSWCEDSDAAVEYFNQQRIDYREIDIEQDPTAAQGVTFVTGGHQITPMLVYRMQAIVLDPWDDERFDAWWRLTNAAVADGQGLN